MLKIQLPLCSKLHSSSQEMRVLSFPCSIRKSSCSGTSVNQILAFKEVFPGLVNFSEFFSGSKLTQNKESIKVSTTVIYWLKKENETFFWLTLISRETR